MDTVETPKPRPSLPLRILRFPLVLMILGFVLFSVLYGLSAFVAGKPQLIHHNPGEPLVMLVMAALGVVIYKFFQRWVEGRDDREFALAGAGGELGRGLMFGFLLFCAVVVAVMLAGGMKIEGLRGMGDLWAMLTMAIASGLYEELIFRGIVFRHLETMLGSWAALAITSAFFGIAHIFNPGATWFAAFAIAVEAGILLGAAFMLTRRLWMAAGLHAAWNFTQGWVFSVPVSGGKAPEGLLMTSRDGAEWLIGGDFGLEASAVALVLATLAGALLLRKVLAHSPAIAPMWAQH